MHKENLFELIRKEEVIIWAGAGMSKYAGYPSGKELRDILVERLTKSEKESIDTNLPLSNLAEEFYRLRGNNKNALIKILKEVYLKDPASTESHNKLATISHFKTIITTNYDTLFENAYKPNAQIIYSTKQVPYVENKKTNIFKVHGDLNEPDSIILTNSDYNRFFKDNSENNTYWSVIRERIATNSILFMGYNLEDPNVSVMFDRITESLGDNSKEHFLVSPGLPQHSINNLIKKGIHYIDCKADEIITELLIHLNKNIVADIENGKLSADTYFHYMSNKNLLSTLKADNDRLKVTSIKGKTDDIHGLLKLTLKNEPEFIKSFNDFATGKTFENFEVPQDKLLNINISYEGVNFLNLEGNGKLEFKSNPYINSTIDIRFEDGFELTNIPVKVYKSPLLIEIHLEIENASIVVKITPKSNTQINNSIKFRHEKNCKNVKSEIVFFNFLKNLSEDKEFVVYSGNQEIYTRSFPKLPELISTASFYLNYFEVLKKIETQYKIRFSNFSIHDINQSSLDTVKYINAIIDNRFLIYDWEDELVMNLIENYDDSVIDQIKIEYEKHPPISIYCDETTIMELHGQKINIGFQKVDFQKTYVSNLYDIIKRKENVLRIKSKTNKMHISFTKEIPKDGVITMI